MNIDLEPHHALAAHAAFPFLILGNLLTSDFELLDLHTWEATEDRTNDIKTRGLGYVGIAGLVQGQPQSALAFELDAPTNALLSGACAQHLAQRVRAHMGAPLGLPTH